MNPISKNIWYVGAEDDNLDLFEGQYPLLGGISYNSYIIEDGVCAVIDAVDIRRCEDWLSAIDEHVESRGHNILPEYLIVQHVEPDHSGSVSAFMRKYPKAKIVCTAKAAEMLGNFFNDMDFTGRIVMVGDGDTLELTTKTLRFFTAPMVHWPEVMMTLDEADGVLFSADAFGTFAMSNGATGEAWDAEARRYYTNIVGRFGASVQGIMKKLTGKPFSVIAPLHGPVLRDNLEHYWALYDKWSRYEPENDGVLVAYASIYGHTAEAARRIATILRQNSDADVVLMDLGRHDVSYAVAEAFRLGKMVLCSPTYDGGMFPAMHDFLYHLAQKNLRGRRVGLIENGSWAPVAGRLMTEMLDKMKDMEIVSPKVTIRSCMHAADMVHLRELAVAMVA